MANTSATSPGSNVKEIAFEERFYWSQNVDKLNQCSRCCISGTCTDDRNKTGIGTGESKTNVSNGDADRDSSSRLRGNNYRMFALTDKRTITWPECAAHDASIGMRIFNLDNMPINRIPHSMFSICAGHSCYIIVCATPRLRSGEDEGSCDNEFYLFVYRFICMNEFTWFEPTQENFPLAYCPISVAKATLNACTFVVISGSDCQLHAYEIDLCTGQLHRTLLPVKNLGDTHASHSSHSHCHSHTHEGSVAHTREDVRTHWDSRLQFESANALGLCLLIEEWTGGSQGIVGHANGLLFSDAFPAPVLASPLCQTSEIDTGKRKAIPSDLFEFEAENTSKVPISPNPKKGHLWPLTALSNFFSDSSSSAPSVSSIPVPMSSAESMIWSHKMSDGIAAKAPSGLSGSPLTLRESLSRNDSGSSLQNLTSPPPVPRSRQCSLLLDGAITCLSLYRTHRVPYAYNYVPLGSLSINGDPLEYACSSSVVVGTTEGVAAVLLLSADDNNNVSEVTDSSHVEVEPMQNVLLPGSGEHGIVQSIVTGDVTMNGFLDVVRIIVRLNSLHS
jgi:hypothetical protein